MSKKQSGKRNTDDDNVKISKNLSYLLRHGATKEGLNIRTDGYVNINEILKLPFYKSGKVSFQKIQEIVDTNDKKRFELTEEVNASNDKEWWIRAVQGHTIQTINDDELLVKIEDPKEFPVCVHGTTIDAWNIIKGDGLRPMGRNHVHFAVGYPGEKEVISGMRKSCKVYVELDLEKAMNDGMELYVSTNKVVLSNGLEGVIKPKYFKKVIIKEGETWKEQNLDSSNPSQIKNESNEEIKMDDATIAQKKQDEGDFDYLCALDFEANCKKDVTLDVQEIIEFPVVIINCKEKKIVDTFHYYVKPVVHPNLYDFCTELTGITQDKVDNGLILQDALKELDAFLTEKGVKNSKWCFVTCGDWDLKTCLKKEATAKKLTIPAYLKTWINLKKVYPTPNGQPAGGMVDLLKLSGLELLGKHHSGIDDTTNIARVIVYCLEQNFAFVNRMVNRLL